MLWKYHIFDYLLGSSFLFSIAWQKAVDVCFYDSQRFLKEDL